MAVAGAAEIAWEEARDGGVEIAKGMIRWKSRLV